MDPEEGIDYEHKAINDHIFTWRFLRSISENNLMKFNNDDRCYNIEHLTLLYVSLNQFTPNSLINLLV